MINAIRKRKDQSGYTMLELLLVLGIIIALAAIMIYAFLSRVNKQSAMNSSSAQVSNIVTSERSAVERQGQIIAFSDQTTAQTLVTYGLQEQIAQDPTHANPWGGGYVVANGSNGQFTITINGLPSNMTKTDGSGYQTFTEELSRLGEGSGIANSGKGATNECTATGNSITCTFDNQ